MSPTCRRFTLVEIVAVMMILALGVGIGVSAVRRLPAFISMEQVVAALKQHCAAARRTASCQRRVVSIWYDPENSRMVSEEGEIPLPEKMRIIIGTRNLREEDKRHDVFVFFPDGSGQAQCVRFELGTDSATIILSPLTGKVFSHHDNAD